MFLFTLGFAQTCFAQGSDDALNKTFEVQVKALDEILLTKEVTLADFHVSKQNGTERITKKKFLLLEFLLVPSLRKAAPTYLEVPTG